MNFIGSPEPPIHFLVGSSQAGKVSNAVATKYPQKAHQRARGCANDPRNPSSTPSKLALYSHPERDWRLSRGLPLRSCSRSPAGDWEEARHLQRQPQRRTTGPDEAESLSRVGY